MDKGKAKADEESVSSSAESRQQGGRPRRYPSLRDQRRFLWEIPVPRDRSPVRVKLELNVDPPASGSDRANEAVGPGSVPDVGKEPETCEPRKSSPTEGQAGEPSQRWPSAGMRPAGTGGLKSKIPYIGQAVSGVIGGGISNGYLLRLSIGDSSMTYPGVLFLPGSFNPFAEEHKVVPNEGPSLKCDSLNPATGAEANSPLVSGAIQLGALNAGGPPGTGDRALEEALKEAATRSMKLSENATNDLLFEVIERVRSKSRRQEPLDAATGPNPSAATAPGELRVMTECYPLQIFTVSLEETSDY